MSSSRFANSVCPYGLHSDQPEGSSTIEWFNAIDLRENWFKGGLSARRVNTLEKFCHSSRSSRWGWDRAAPCSEHPLPSSSPYRRPSPYIAIAMHTTHSGHPLVGDHKAEQNAILEGSLGALNAPTSIWQFFDPSVKKARKRWLLGTKLFYQKMFWFRWEISAFPLRDIFLVKSVDSASAMGCVDDGGTRTNRQTN